ncbi:MAG: hypothetical protein KGJ43_06255, partial [Acidobacteriota bacterium]|nr:hypothetical protein [Acidobacteriota bacterium]
MSGHPMAAGPPRRPLRGGLPAAFQRGRGARGLGGASARRRRRRDPMTAACADRGHTRLRRS